MALVFLLGEFSPQDLAHGAFGQLIDKFDDTRNLIGRQMLPAIVHNFLLGHCLALFQDHKSLDGFAAVVVLEADGAGLQNFRMTEQHAVDFHGIDVVAAGNDHVFLAVGDAQIAVFVKAADIAGMKLPAASGRGIWCWLENPVKI